MKNKSITMFLIAALFMLITGCDLSSIDEAKSTTNNNITADPVKERILLSSALKEYINFTLSDAVYATTNSTSKSNSRSDTSSINDFIIPGKVSGSLTIKGSITKISDSSDDTAKGILTLTFNNYSNNDSSVINSGVLDINYSDRSSARTLTDGIKIPQMTTKYIKKGNLVITYNSIQHSYSMDGSDEITKCFRGITGYDESFNYQYTLDGETWIENNDNTFTESEKMVAFIQIDRKYPSQWFYKATKINGNQIEIVNPQINGLTSGSVSFKIDNQSNSSIQYTADFNNFKDEPYFYDPTMSGKVISTMGTKFTYSTSSLIITYDPESKLTSGDYSFNIEIIRGADNIEKVTAEFGLNGKTFYIYQ